MKIYLYKNLNSIVLHRWNYIENYSDFILRNKDKEVLVLDNANFKFENNVYTEFIFNFNNDYKNLKVGTIFTYMIVDDDGYFSSWYVANTILNRGGQFKLKLKRDILNDYIKYIKLNDFNVSRSFFNNNMTITKNILPHLINESSDYLTNMNDNLKELKRIDFNYSAYNGDWTTPAGTNQYPGSSTIHVQADEEHGAFAIYFADNILDISGTTREGGDYPVFGVWSNYDRDRLFDNYGSWNGYLVGNNEDYEKGLTCWVVQGKSSQVSTEPYHNSILLNKLPNTVGYVLIIPRYFGEYDISSYRDHLSEIIRLKERFGDFIIDIQYIPYFFSSNSYRRYNYWAVEKYKDSNGSEIYGSRIPFIQMGESDLFGHRLIELDSEFKNFMYSGGLLQKKAVLHHTHCEFVSPSQQYRTSFNYFKAYNIFENRIPTIYFYYKFMPYQFYTGVSFTGNCYYNLYGNNIKDLFFTPSEDYTIDLTSSQFSNYQLNNKNYQSIFNRQLASSDVSATLNITKNALSSQANAMGQIFSGHFAKGIAGSISSSINTGFDIGSYFNSRQTNIDVYNMQIDNIRNRPDTPIIKGNFGSQYLNTFVVKYFINDENSIQEYKKILQNKGIMFDFRNVKLKEMYSELQLTTIDNVYGIKPYFEGEMISNNNDSTNYFDNFLWNEINSELSSGVYLTENALKEIIK